MMGRVNVRNLFGCFLLIALFFAAPAVVHAQHADEAATATATRSVDGEAHAADEDAHAEDEHAHEAHPPALPTVIGVINGLHLEDGRTVAKTDIGKFLYKFEKQIYIIIVTVGLLLFFNMVRKRSALRPGKLQVAMEMLAEGLVNFFTGIVGKEHKKHVPFLCSLFIFLWVNNLTALVPGMAPMTAYYQNTLIFALLVFFYFIFYGIKDGGLGHFLWHMAGSPKDPVGWIVSPFIFILELVGNLAKPLSLSLRLFGNILGEDILLGVSLMLGILMATIFAAEPVIGVPLHLPFMFLVLLGGTIQALVFSLLAAIYIAMVLPHHDHEHDGEHHADEHPLLPAAEARNENSLHVDAGTAPFVG
jgi:F-type H+-transporting ATPase subunit a